MRRKSDAWINATHILKIAKFPKAKRTRILEKDVQTGIHEKVQGGYGKFQGTYVPLDLGREIARSFGVLDVLRPIFDFQYIEGQLETPPPAPKHNHALALNVAKRAHKDNETTKKFKTVTGEPKKRGRPRRITLAKAPDLKHEDTVPINGPSIGTFSTSPTLAQRQDTLQDAHIKDEDLELADSDDELDSSNKVLDELMNHKELFGRDLFDRVGSLSVAGLSQQNLQLPRTALFDPYSLLQYHLLLQKPESVYGEYFSSLLSYFLDDKKGGAERLMNPPQPLSKININQPIDNDGNTIFHWACLMGNTQMMEFLLETFQVPADIRNTLGETPLMFLVKFNNSFEMGNFAHVLALLALSTTAVDNRGKTVLHHIAALDKSKERFGKHYMEALLGDTESEDTEEKEKTEDTGNAWKNIQDSHLDGNMDDSGSGLASGTTGGLASGATGSLSSAPLFQSEGSPSPSPRVSAPQDIGRFLNHQDADGNTAFHIAAHNLNKKLIRVFLAHHKQVDFTLRNLVSYLVEDYLALHNFVLRLDNADNDEVPGTASMALLFDSLLSNTKAAVKMHNTMSNLITERLTELAYAIDKELNEKDEAIVAFFKVVRMATQAKLESQRSVLALFRMDHLVDELDQGGDEDADDVLGTLRHDQVLQDEINRLINDLCFQFLQKKEEFDEKAREYCSAQNRVYKRRLEEMQEEDSENSDTKELGDSHGKDNGVVGKSDGVADDDSFELAVELSKQIVRRRKLMKELYREQLRVDDGVDDRKLPERSIIDEYLEDDKLNKYCRLLSLCCGMEVAEVESSIELIEQLLRR